MITKYEVLEVAFGPPTARFTNEAVTCKWGLIFKDDDGNDIHVQICDCPPDERPPDEQSYLRNTMWQIGGVDNEPTIEAVLARLHRESPDIGTIASMVFREGGGGAAAEE